jgi:hypothetical protein
MNSPSRNSDLIIREAASSLAAQRAGGIHRRSIGRASAKLKFNHLGKKLLRTALALGAIFLGISILGSILGGIGITGLLGTLLLAGVAAVFLLRYPKLKVPQRADLQTEDVKRLVGQTEFWLEAQCKALPPPAAKAVSYIGLQLDGLQQQLVEVDQKHPTAAQIRKLVGEDLPDMIDGYRKIPEHLRYEERAGSTPNKQLMDGLDLISKEIDSVTRQLAQGSLDDLAIKTRYLEYRYNDGDVDDRQA